MTSEQKISDVYGETVDFDTAIALTGYGKFHYEVVTVCFLSILMVGFQNGLPPYILPAAQCELDLTSFHLGLLNVCFLIGGIVSCFVWGLLSDTHGRKKILIYTHFLDAFITIICSIIPHVAALVACRLLNGFLIGAPASIVYSYITEFQPLKYRSRCICYCGLVFTISWLILPGLAYYVLPLEIQFDFSIFSITSWRLFMIILALPELLIAVRFLRMAESPKFYFANGNSTMALMVLRDMFAANTGNNAVLYPVKNLISGQRPEDNKMTKVTSKGKTARLFQRIGGEVVKMFKPPLSRATALTCTIMFTNMFGMFGLGLWLPDLFSKLEQYESLYPDRTFSVQELASLSQLKNNTCEPSFKSTVIYNTIATAVSAIAYNAISSWVSVILHAKTITMVSMIVGGISAGVMFWLRTSVQHVIAACVFQATMITANMTIAGLGVELFPTKVNSIAVCLIMCAGRFGAVLSNSLFGWLMDTHCEIPIFVVAFIVVCGGGLCSVVPKKPKSSQLVAPEVKVSVISDSWKS